MREALRGYGCCGVLYVAILLRFARGGREGVLRAIFQFVNSYLLFSLVFLLFFAYLASYSSL